MSNLGIMHWKAVNWVLRYLKGIGIEGIVFNGVYIVQSVVGCEVSFY